MIVLEIILILLLIFTLCSGVYLFVEGIKDSEWFGIICGLFLVLVVILPIGYFGYDSYKKDHCTVTIEKVNAVVEGKQHIEAYTTMIASGKTFIPIFHPEQWNVKLVYNNVEKTIDGKGYYDGLQENDKIQVDLKTYTFKSGKVYKKELYISENN